MSQRLQSRMSQQILLQDEMAGSQQLVRLDNNDDEKTILMLGCDQDEWWDETEMNVVK